MVRIARRRVSKARLLLDLKHVFFVLLGSLILAFADAAFLAPCNIISGGVISVGIIVNYYVEPLIDFDVTSYVVLGVQVILWFIGLFALGKRFSIQTLLASLAYPLFFLIFHNSVFDVAEGIGIVRALGLQDPTNIDTGSLMICGIFGGALAGAGVAVAYLGNGSTGGFDIVSFIIAKYSEMKQDVSGFIIDASLVIVGMVCLRDIRMSLIGIIAALACAVAVQYIYVNSDTFVIVDIISDHYSEIQDYIHKEMNHGTTVINTIGGYSGEKRKMIRVVIYQIETTELRSKIGEIDKDAFVSFMQAKTINGEGFEPFIPRLSKHSRPRAALERAVMAEKFAKQDAEKAAKRASKAQAEAKKAQPEARKEAKKEP
ncbi:MAG: YitT family protein [Bacilli bacterium]|nr:YitT family protein [Bacilli bacterium]